MVFSEPQQAFYNRVTSTPMRALQVRREEKRPWLQGRARRGVTASIKLGHPPLTNSGSRPGASWRALHALLTPLPHHQKPGRLVAGF